jgi:uncharacterized protein DUF5658
MIIPVMRGSSREAHRHESRETLPLGVRSPMSPLLSPSKSPRTTRPARPHGTRPLSRPRAAGALLPPLLGLFAVLNIGDLASTYLGLASGMREGNPLMSTLLGHYGFGALVVYKALVILAVTAGVYLLRSFHLKIAHITIWVCNALVFAVVVLNLVQFAFIS